MSKIVVVALLLFVFQNSAYAYIDPGTGMLIIQGFIAAVAAVVATAKLYWSKIKAFFAGEKVPASDSEPAPASNDDEPTDPS